MILAFMVEFCIQNVFEPGNKEINQKIYAQCRSFFKIRIWSSNFQILSLYSNNLKTDLHRRFLILKHTSVINILRLKYFLDKRNW